VIGAMGVPGALYMNAASFLASLLIFVAVVPRLRVSAATAADEAASNPTFAALWRLDYFRQLLVSGLLTGLVLTPFLALLLPVLLVQTFQTPPLLGIALAAFGLAATLGALLFA